MKSRDTEANAACLADYRRRVAELYAAIRGLGTGHPDAHRLFRETRDELFARHPHSPLDPVRRGSFEGLRYYPYDPGLRFSLPIGKEVQREVFELRLAGDGPLSLERIARVQFRLADQPVTLSLFWIRGYGGGLFLPFRDATNGAETYGGGRYLLDTIKGVDLGQEGDELVLDFNYAYNPSCAYDPRWDCPLAPTENWIELPVAAGEMSFDEQ
jgi:uncharacterized protein (DUF1684 family)